VALPDLQERSHIDGDRRLAHATLGIEDNDDLTTLEVAGRFGRRL